MSEDLTTMSTTAPAAGTSSPTISTPARAVGINIRPVPEPISRTGPFAALAAST